MKSNHVFSIKISVAAFAAILCLSPSFAQTTSSSPAGSATSPAVASGGAPDEAEMMKQMMEMGKLNENHKLLGELSGTWNYTVKYWPAPGAPPQESKGVAVRKPVMEGRFYLLEVNGKMKMPGPDGKMKDVDFKGSSMEGYDNVKKKFIGTWCDNMSTGILMSEGTYDAANKTFNYNSEMEMIPGMKTKVREMLKVVDKDHHTFEWYEDRGGKEDKTMEIAYTRKK